jgi:hypothetical protein
VGNEKLGAEGRRFYETEQRVAENIEDCNSKIRTGSSREVLEVHLRYIFGTTKGK